MRRALIPAAVLLALTVQVRGQTPDCMSCHGQKAKAKQTGASIVDSQVLAQSVHADLSCRDCHDINCEKRHKDDRTVYCARCHMEEAKGYNQSQHVRGRKAGIEKLPTCITCHGGHDVLPVHDEMARTSHRNSVKLCTSCHEDTTLTEKVAELPKPAMVKSYRNSIHGRKLLVEHNLQAPACVDCHGSHMTLPADSPESPVYKTRIAETCGKCHDTIAVAYENSVHGKALANGVMEAPTCTNCHGEHNIRAPQDPKSKVYPTHVSQTCADCHASPKVVAKYGLKADRIGTFKESFHGAASALGDIQVANCASCHGVHNIYPQEDPRSTINAANIQKTCGQCHKDLPKDFTKGQVHTSASSRESGGAYYVRKFYAWFITIIIAAFLLYRVLEYRRRAAKREE
ncbi:MAG: hypothetical protein D6800_01180 [Candidatus Zixiibacteriota bacterium]|nr:MAG: hypothetical protein D6800_01180 [candidate division Zixibacteria bacterium]